MERRGLISERAWAALLFAGLALTSPCAQAQSNPSFDCRKATTAVEKVICSDRTLGDLDRQMAKTFRQALAKAPVGERDAIIKRQIGWLQDRAIACGLDPNQEGFHLLGAPPSAQCLADVYEGWLKNQQERIVAPYYAPPRRTALPFDTRRQPFSPRLLVSRDAELCNAFLSALRRDFLARHGDDERPFKQPPIAVGHWVAWPSEHGAVAPADPAMDVAELDLDGNGRKQLLLHVTQSFSRGNTYSLLIRSKTSTDGLFEDIKDFVRVLPWQRQSDSIRSIAPYDFGGPTSPLKVLAYRSGMYLYGQGNDITSIAQGDPRDGTAALSRIHADGSTELRCHASVWPRAGTVLPAFWATKPPDTISVPAPAVEWLQTVREIQGNEGPLSGTLHALQRVINSSSNVWYDALVRPWDVAVIPPPYEQSPAAMRSWIQHWGYQSLSRFRLARAFETGRHAAIDALAEYYERSFGAANGKEAALAITDNIIAASFVVHGLYGANQLSPEQAVRYAESQDWDDDSRRLRSALLIGASANEVDALIKSGAALDGRTKWGTLSPEPALFYALEHVNEVSWLLDRGADINEGNAFGKTALMYAAHYNLDTTVTLLLARGADVTKRTDARNSGDTSLRFDSRTALMYAAENASERMIRELIQAGSDTCATDSGDRDVWNYASRNKRLSDDARARVALLIARKPCNLTGQIDRAR